MRSSVSLGDLEQDAAVNAPVKSKRCQQPARRAAETLKTEMIGVPLVPSNLERMKITRKDREKIE